MKLRFCITLVSGRIASTLGVETIRLTRPVPLVRCGPRDSYIVLRIHGRHYFHCIHELQYIHGLRGPLH